MAMERRVPADATVADALIAARDQAAPDVRDTIPWDSAPTRYLRPVLRRARMFRRQGDRIELYRPLAADPKERRRQQVQDPTTGGAKALGPRSSGSVVSSAAAWRRRALPGSVSRFSASGIACAP